MFTRARFLRTFAALLVAMTLIASSLATTFGAVANVGVGGGWDTSLSNANGVSGATPTKVTPGKVAGFYLFTKNNDTANLSSFFLTATTAATPKGAFWGHTPNGPWTACDISKGLSCNFGAFNSGAAVYIVAAFTLPSSASTSRTNCLTDPNRTTQPPIAYGKNPTGASWVCVDFQFGSNSGYVPGKNNSRGDAYHWFDAVGTDTGQDDAATFPFCNLASSAACDSGLLTINDSKANFGRTNAQWTQVQAPNVAGTFNSAHATTAIGVADNVAFDCAAATGLAECTSANLAQWSEVDVNSGQEFADGTPWVVINIGVYGLSANKISTVFHFYQDSANVWHVESIDTRCADSSGPASLFNADQCFWVTSLKGNSSQVTVWTHHNGKLNIG